MIELELDVEIKKEGVEIKVGKVELLISVIVVAGIELLSALLLFKIIEWYVLPVSLTYKQVMGIYFLFSILMHKSSENSMVISSSSKLWSAIFTKAIYVSFMFAILYLISIIIK